MRRSERASAAAVLPPAALFALLMDTARAAEWVPGVTSARTLAEEGELSILELTVPRYGGTAVFEVVATPGRSLALRRVDREQRNGIEVRVDIAPARDGRNSVVAVQAALTSSLFAVGTRRRLRAFLSAALAALQQRAGQVAIAPEPRRLLAVRTAGGGLEVEVGQRRFRLPAAELSGSRSGT